MAKERIGFLGLGAMGKPMAANLLKAGYPLATAVHRNRAPAEELAKAGATVVDSVEEVARNAGVLITMLPADAEIEEVYGRVMPVMAKGSLCIDMTSAKPDTIVEVARRAAERGLQVVDAPVSGGIAKAVDGSLTIMAGGEGEALKRARPILDVMGGVVYETGAVGSGKAFKMINQLLNAGNTLIASEALYLARRLNLDLEKLVGVVGESSGGSWIFANKVPGFMAPREFEKGFKLKLMNKDVGLSVDYARSQGIAVPVATLLGQVFQAMMNQGNGERDYTVISRWVEQQNVGQR